jgi:hypothetical protein
MIKMSLYLKLILNNVNDGVGHGSGNSSEDCVDWIILLKLSPNVQEDVGYTFASRTLTFDGFSPSHDALLGHFLPVFGEDLREFC